MKTKCFFQSVAYSIKRNADTLRNIAFILWLIIATIVGYNLIGKYQQDSLPTEAKYQEYEKILKQITEEGMHDVEIPEEATLRIYQEEIEISNDKGKYSVSGNYKEENINLTRDSGNEERIAIKILFGGVFFGLMVLGVLGYGILYLIIYLVSKIVEFLGELKSDYDYKKRELKEEEKRMLESKETESRKKEWKNIGNVLECVYTFQYIVFLNTNLEK